MPLITVSLFFLAALFGAACMAVPPHLRVIVRSNTVPYCLREVNCYLVPPQNTIVLVPGQPLKVAFHEACHAHQAWEVEHELGIPASVDEHEWYLTREARDYGALVAQVGEGPNPPAWADPQSLLEDFSESCGRFLAHDPNYPTNPAKDKFFESRGYR